MQLFLQHKPYRVLTLSILLGIFGTTLFDLVSVLYAATFPNPELAVGLASLITSLPYVFDFIVGYVSDRASNSFKAMKLVRWLQMSLYVFFGVLTLLKPSWWVFVLVLAINFMSDIIGNYTAYLNLSLNRRVVDEENFSLAISFRKGMSNIVTLAGKSVGVMLIALLAHNYFLFALINVLVFLASYLVLRRGRKLFDHLDEPIPESKEQQAESLKSLICQFVRDTITNFTFLKSQSSIFNLVMIYSSMNLLSSAMATLLMIYLLSVKELQLGSYAVTITVFESIELVAFFLGSLFPFDFYRKWSIRSNLLFENSLALLMIISIFVWHNPIVLFTLLFLSSYATAISNPKSDTIVIFSIVEERQNAVFSIFSTIVTATVPLGAAVILALNQSLGATWSWTLLAFLAVFNIGYTCFWKEETRAVS